MRFNTNGKERKGEKRKVVNLWKKNIYAVNLEGNRGTIVYDRINRG